MEIVDDLPEGTVLYLDCRHSPSQYLHFGPPPHRAHLQILGLCFWSVAAWAAMVSPFTTVSMMTPQADMAVAVAAVVVVGVVAAAAAAVVVVVVVKAEEEQVKNSHRGV
ncbi:hypothetical protein HZS61_005607 [Fusarium oxysporum f. sp. conglutinans]|uniref:Transmembrane protein n=1 Tax=Fusarium oxysporum f. sp. conglutinans TaxID=100902 RepID=A0A8H6LCU0_FUSOX|nr:hypothetical protein HZS61_005607 [Fusarium oxysporum f. sp. conglutinans]